MRSLRHALLATLLLSVTAVTLAAAAATYQMARREIDEIFDYHLRQIALSLRDAALEGYPAPPAPGQAFDFTIQIWARNGSRLYLSRPDAGLPDLAELGFATVKTSQGPWRVYSAAIGSQVIQVAQPMAVRQERALAAALRTLAPLLLLLPVLALVVWRLVGRGLEPLNRLAGAAASRTPASLEPFAEAGVPEEALPLVRALNDLLSRLAAALAAQRAFVADAAHELRTPLAALKLQVQLASREGDPAGRTAALAEAEAGLARAARVVQQLLTLAREEPGAASPGERQPLSLAELVAQAVADHAVLAESKGLDLGAAHVDEGLTIVGDAQGIRTLLANLVDNAIRYTPAGGRIDLSVRPEGDRPCLEVADTGPGIPPEERDRVFDRFYRRPGSGESGSGLGLAIVRAVAARHGAEVELADAQGGGLRVRVLFPPVKSVGSDARPVRDPAP